MIRKNFRKRRMASFLQYIFIENRRKRLIAIAVLAFLFLCFPSLVHRTPSIIYETHYEPQEVVIPEEVPSVFDPFPFPEELNVQVDFWKKIFTKYTTKQAVIHDARYFEVIYEVIDVDDPKFASEKEGWKAVKKAQKKYEQLLQNMMKHWGNPQKMNEEEQQLYAHFKDVDESSYFKKKYAKDRVRIQVGQADRFKAGIVQSGQYIAAMKRIFAEHDLPENLVYLPLIESAFNPFARSHVGAAGMWQFMRGTGKQYKLKITHLIDERHDPLRATHAAARLLAHNYEETQSWPLAITAYNFGLQGIKNATAAMKSDDIVKIIEQYNGSRFGFASRNFYVEFLAAVDVCLRYTEYFGEIDLHEPLKITQVSLPDYVSAKTLAKYYDFTVDELQELNPALHSSVFNRGGFIPKNYALNILEEHKSDFETRYAAIPQSLRYKYLPVRATHRVKRGQTLSVIAKRYRTSVKALMRANNIKNARKVRAGKVLKIPGGYVTLAQKSKSPSASSSSSSSGRTHRVKKGQTLSTIAKLYGTSVKAITTLNKISNPRKIKAGQTLKIPNSNAKSAKAEHRVKKGQTLSMIAKLHNTSVKAIAKANSIKNPRYLKVGQVLKIPKG